MGTSVVVLRDCPSIYTTLVFMVCGQGIVKPGQGKVMEKSGIFFREIVRTLIKEGYARSM